MSFPSKNQSIGIVQKLRDSQPIGRQQSCIINSISYKQMNSIEKQGQKKNTIKGRWSKSEHDRFMKAIEKFGKDWMSVQKIVKSRSLTQVRSHAQKVFLHMDEADVKALFEKEEESDVKVQSRAFPKSKYIKWRKPMKRSRHKKNRQTCCLSSCMQSNSNRKNSWVSVTKWDNKFVQRLAGTEQAGMKQARVYDIYYFQFCLYSRATITDGALIEQYFDFTCETVKHQFVNNSKLSIQFLYIKLISVSGEKVKPHELPQMGAAEGTDIKFGIQLNLGIILRSRIMELNNVQSQELYSGIFLRKKLVVIDQQLTYVFELDVQDLNTIDFQIDFKGSEKISIKGYGNEATVVFKTVEPRSSPPTMIAQVELHEGWKLKTVFRFLRKPISKQKQLNFIKSSNNDIETEKKSVEAMFKKIEVTLTPLQQLNSLLQKSKIKFVDVDFPPDQSSILGDSDKNLIDDTVNHWRRPISIFDNSKPYYLIDRLNSKNIVMGKLLDHAFYSVVCTLTMTHPSLIERLFFNQKSINENGIYRLLLCKNGEWQTVTIDDYIPCQPFAKPKFASSTRDEIWVSLLQKAYAKVHGRYLALHELEVSNVFADLTGCPTIIVNLNSQDAIETVISNFKANNVVVFYDIEQSQFDEDQFTPLKHFAYPMVGYEAENKKNYFKFISHTKNQQQLSEDDLPKKFKYACICKIQNWEEVRIKGKFVSIQIGTPQQQNSIVMSRWYYSLQIHEQSEVHICLHQEDLLIRNNAQYKEYKYLSIVVFQKGEKSKLNAIFLKKFVHNREFQFSLQLKPGIYLIVPILNEQFSKKKPPTQFDQVNDIYRKLDLLMRRSLKYEELQLFYKVVGQVFDQSTFEQILKTYTKQKKGIGFLAFKNMWQKNKIYWSQPATNYYLRQDLFVLSVHSKHQINLLIKSNIGTDLNNRAHCEMILKYGKQLELSKTNRTYARVMFLESKCHIIQYMVENRFERKITITIDCNESALYNFMPVSGKLTYQLDSGEKRFIMKLTPKEKSDPKHLIRKETISIKVD